MNIFSNVKFYEENYSENTYFVYTSSEKYFCINNLIVIRQKRKAFTVLLTMSLKNKQGNKQAKCKQQTNNTTWHLKNVFCMTFSKKQTFTTYKHKD